MPHQEASDEVNVARVASLKDLEAFAALYDRHARAVYGLAVHLLGVSEAEDAVQEVFLRLWRKAPQFDPARSQFKAWFMAIARNHVLDLLRRRSQGKSHIIGEAMEQLLVNSAIPDADPEEQSWLRERSEVVLAALRSLPTEQRQALVLAYFGGLSQSAIAEQLGWPLGTVKKRIRLAMQKLRAALAQKGMLESSQVQPRQRGTR